MAVPSKSESLIKDFGVTLDHYILYILFVATFYMTVYNYMIVQPSQKKINVCEKKATSH